MPSSTPTTTIDAVTLRVTKGTTPTTIGGRFTETGINFVKVESITPDGRIEFGKLAYIDQETDNLLTRSRLQADDILFSIAGTIGRVSKVTPELLPANTNQAVAIIRPDKAKIVPDYLAYMLRNRATQQLVHEGVVQAVQANFSLGSIRGLQILLPSLAEQQKMIEPLKALDDKINLLRETNATLEAIAQALFKSWFVDFDPVRAKAEGHEPEGVPPDAADLFPSEFEESELGQIPSGWRVGRLGEISRNVRVGAKPDELTDDTAYIGLEHMPRRSIALDEWESASKIESGKFRFKKGQILFGKLRPYFHKVGIAPLDGVCSTDILVIEPSFPGCRAICVCHYSSKALVEHATQLSNGAKMPRTSWADLANYRIAIPPDNVAQAFENIVSPLLERIPENVHQAKTLAETRNTMLPGLMSGKLRIPSAQQELEKAYA